MNLKICEIITTPYKLCTSGINKFWNNNKDLIKLSLTISTVAVCSGALAAALGASIPVTAAVLAIASGIDDNFIEVTGRTSKNPMHPNHCLGRRAGKSLELTGPLGTSIPLELVTPQTPVLLVLCNKSFKYYF